MKLITKLLLLTLFVGIAGSCTKLEESPAPGTTANNGGGTGGGGGGGGGNADVYIGLWKCTDRQLGAVGGPSIYDANSTYKVKLDVAATATFTPIVNGVEGTPVSDSYLMQVGPPAMVIFTDAGSREVVTKTGTQIVWQYNDPNLSGALVVETLDKQ